MLKKIFSRLKSKPEVNCLQPKSFNDSVKQAHAFTVAKKFKPDTALTKAPVDVNQLELIAKEVAKGLFDQIKQYQSRSQNIYMSLGGDCGNVHLLIARFIHTNYKVMDINLTMGNVKIDHQGGFEFSQEKFLDWVSNGHGPAFDCHSWVTVGEDFIIDATIATYINTRLQSVMKFGGVLYGKPGSLKCIAIENESHQAIPIDTQIDFEPVVFGEQAFLHVTSRNTPKA